VYIYNKKLDIRKRKIKNKKEVTCKKEIKLAYQRIHVIEFQIFIDDTLAERNADVIHLYSPNSSSIMINFCYLG
jgi:hypothetical protein